MSTGTDDLDRELLTRALKQDPDEFLAEHENKLRDLRERVDSDRLVAAIDAVLADLDRQEGSP